MEGEEKDCCKDFWSRKIMQHWKAFIVFVIGCIIALAGAIMVLFWFIQTSDIGDLYHSILIPYCNIAIVDNSRFDTCDKLKNEIEKYITTKILNKREILKII